jgi:glycosyltransferase involved in cell wall biosynthesis
MHSKQLISLVLPVFNEEAGLRQILPEIKRLELINEIIVVDNNSTDDSRKVANSFEVRVISASVQGYGAALKMGILSAKSELIITMEPDGTFLPSDIYKFLPYTSDSDIVLGTRTANSLIWDGAYMPLWVKWGNWFVAKLIEILFNGPSLTDAGCTLKLMKKSAISRINLANLTDKSHFNAELLIAICDSKIKTVEIPINYVPRLGDSKITGNNPIRTLMLGLRMIRVILFARTLPVNFRKWRNNES